MNIGTRFGFHNRENQCYEFFQKIFELDFVRIKSLKKSFKTGWELYKREILIIIAMGIGGIGKSLFAREAINKFLHSCSDKLVGDQLVFFNFLKDRPSCNIRIGKFVYSCIHSFNHSFHSFFIYSFI